MDRHEHEPRGRGRLGAGELVLDPGASASAGVVRRRGVVGVEQESTSVSVTSASSSLRGECERPIEVDARPQTEPARVDPKVPVFVVLGRTGERI